MTSSKRIRKHLATSTGAPRCGRQLSRPATNTANQASMQITAELSEVGCRHCLRVAGVLAPLTRSVNFDDVPSALELDEENEDDQ